MGYAGVRDALAAPAGEASGPVLPMRFRKNESALSLFTTITTLGTPQDIALEELPIECFFPMDDATAATFRGWTSQQTGT